MKKCGVPLRGTDFKMGCWARPLPEKPERAEINQMKTQNKEKGPGASAFRPFYLFAFRYSLFTFHERLSAAGDANPRGPKTGVNSAQVTGGRAGVFYPGWGVFFVGGAGRRRRGLKLAQIPGPPGPLIGPVKTGAPALYTAAPDAVY